MFRALYRFLHPRFQNVFLDYKVEQRPRYGHGAPPHQRLYDLISSEDEGYAERLVKMLDYAVDIRGLGGASGFRWDNGYLPGLDVIALYYMIASSKPRYYIEIGGGYSTLVADMARQKYSKSTRITSIDPAPRADVIQVADVVIQRTLETADLSIFDQLSDGDILFVDNSHRILPNSDSTVFFLEILPRLSPGVIIHIHDVYWPYDYPQFMCDRFYSEQYALGVALLSNPAMYEILLPNYYISEDPHLSDIMAHIWNYPELEKVEKHGGSFWMKVK